MNISFTSSMHAWQPSSTVKGRPTSPAVSAVQLEGAGLCCAALLGHRCCQLAWRAQQPLVPCWARSWSHAHCQGLHRLHQLRQARRPCLALSAGIWGWQGRLLPPGALHDWQSGPVATMLAASWEGQQQGAPDAGEEAPAVRILIEQMNTYYRVEAARSVHCTQCSSALL